MSYQNYVISRNWSWKKLIYHNEKRLPIKISKICEAEGIEIIPYKDASDIQLFEYWRDSVQGDGFAIDLNGRKFIFYNDACTVERQRFTVAHEYGHHVRGNVSKVPTCRNNEPSEEDDLIERGANIIASRLLAPACVLWGIGVHSANEIAELCHISAIAAEWRMERLNKLYEREQEFLQTRGYSCFLQSDLEKQVFAQFKAYINEIKDQRACL